MCLQCEEFYLFIGIGFRGCTIKKNFFKDLFIYLKERRSGGAEQKEREREKSRLPSELRLHEEKVIKDRRHHLKTYPNCFVAKELIDWLIEHKEASDRETAVKLMQKLADRGIIHHVCDEHKEFKDVKLFYRFRKDDGTFPLDNEVKAFMRGQRLYEKLMSPENTLLQPREEEGVKYERTFMASEFLDWLVQEGEATSRKEAEQLCHRLMEHGIIQHVSNKHPFVDSNLLYQFRMNFRRRRRLMELLNEKSPSSQETHDSPFCLRKQSHDNRKSTSFMSGMSVSLELKGLSPQPLLKRPVTSEELLTPGAPYARKTFTIVGDAVGWGFVVRGSKPCHIQAVDPSGPAAAAGMKVPPTEPCLNTCSPVSLFAAICVSHPECFGPVLVKFPFPLFFF
uniref:DEP domain containing MTOR interacting protein n=1 Tax=Ursus maritimus TaxID=29073 RepID=A0A452V7F6_URSMA